MVLEIVSICISVTAVFFTYQGLKRAREHNRKSVEPYLVYDSKFESLNKSCVVKIHNKGIGPAIITDFRLCIDGEMVKGIDLPKFYELLQKKLDKINQSNSITANIDMRYFGLDRGYALKVNEAYTFLEISSDNFDTLRKVLDNIDGVCRYKSLYDEKQEMHFILNNTDNEPSLID